MRYLSFILSSLCFLALLQADQNPEPQDPADKKIGLPLWEAGLFIGLAQLPEYRGSDETRFYTLPLPFLIYRGQHVQVDRQGVLGHLLQGRRWKLSMSFFGHPPVKSDSHLRRGMDDLDPMIEMGPMIHWSFYDTLTYQQKIVLKLRTVMSIDAWELDHQGYRGTLQWAHHYLLNPTWRLGWNLNILYGDARYHRYLYGVKVSEVSPTRAAYAATSGYAGTGISFNLLHKVSNRHRVGAFCNLDSLHGSIFENSPLIGNKLNYAFGVGWSWQLLSSKEQMIDPESEDVDL